MFKKVLIANRGEIAVRVMRACREMGIRTVAAYSEADSHALHTRQADEAIAIGPPPVSQSYLNIERLIAAAHESGAEAIHPGYGLLSENAAFAQAVIDSGLVFIGPNPKAIQIMGDKAAARELMLAAGVAVVPGYQGPDSDTELENAAEKLGFPVLVKAAAGGGGKGMRAVWRAEDFRDSAAAARREAMAAFGDGHLILERYIPRAHHVEFQILGDQHGHIVHLFERDCSVQRRHQKIIEESPSPLLDPALRQRMGQAAVSAAQAVGYTNAGTVEFILDPGSGEFYFLEMNTRLQVEHPVTEMVTGLDLVQLQLSVAAGNPLPFSQGDVSQRGHAIECRLYAEDPANQFLPATGRLLRFVEPKGPNIRVDSGVSSGDEISIHYDPLIAKIIVRGENRLAAIRKMQNTLQETVILGLQTNWKFLQDILDHPDFIGKKAYTTWVEDVFDSWQEPFCEIPPEVLVVAALSQFQAPAQVGASNPTSGGSSLDPYSPWSIGNNYRTGE